MSDGSEPTRTGDRFEDHRNEIEDGPSTFTAEVDGDELRCHYDDGFVAGPFDLDESLHADDEFESIDHDDSFDGGRSR